MLKNFVYLNLWCFNPFSVAPSYLTLYQLVLSADNLCKQSEPRSGPTKSFKLICIQTVWHSDGIPENIF